jgi:hypothetical protein
VKTIEAYEVIMAILATKDECRFSDINQYRDDYYKNHPNSGVYFEVYRDAIFSDIHYHEDELYWDYKNEVIIKQETVYCPICGSKHRKYPENDLFKKIKALQSNPLDSPLESNE